MRFEGWVSAVGAEGAAAAGCQVGGVRARGLPPALREEAGRPVRPGGQQTPQPGRCQRGTGDRAWMEVTPVAARWDEQGRGSSLGASGGCLGGGCPSAACLKPHGKVGFRARS